MTQRVRVATDVGGTFTDLVCFITDEATGQTQLVTAKTDTTTGAFQDGVLNAIRMAGLDPADFEFFAHGTTVVINALTERKGVKVGLITTEGFRDTLEIARGNRPDMFNRQYHKPEPFVPRYLRQEVPGRMDHKGNERSPIVLSGLPSILAAFRTDGVEAVAICLLHSYANPAHEQAVADEIARLWPGVAIVASHQITREWREYERSNTAVLSAYVQPFAERYLNRLAGALSEGGFTGRPFLMQSNCGIDVLESVARTPITMVESGPASGFWGAAQLAKTLGESKVLALDIGGTTAKCSLILDGAVVVKNDYAIERNRKSAGYPIMVPVVDLVEIGNGGGSIAWVDDFHKLHVGPQSAGSVPGPASYGRGGTQPTTTDANLWLGRINRDYFCGGTVTADMVAVESSLSGLADKLGIGTDDVARGILRIADNAMVNALKLVSLNRGHDPREFTLLAFGGGGAMHASALAADIGVRKVIVPATAAVFSAWGMMMSDFRRDYFITHLRNLDAAELPSIAQVFEQASVDAVSQFERDGIDTGGLEILRFARLRYQNQEHTIEVRLDRPVDADNLDALLADFHAAYEQAYTYRLDAPVEMVGLHVVARASIDKVEIARKSTTGASLAAALKGRRLVDYGVAGRAEAAIYDGAALEPGMAFAGPAIIEDPGTTIVVRPGDAVVIDDWGNTVIHIGEAK